MTTHSIIPLSSIETGDRLRAADPSWVAFLAEEIALDGLIEPIRVVIRGNGYKLVDGARRVAAHIELGREEIEARIEPEDAFASDVAIRLAEIKGHLLRGALSALEHAVSVSAWCDIYQGVHGKPKRGPKPKIAAPEQGLDETLAELSAAACSNWSEAAQEALGLSKRSLFYALKIARIDPAIRRRIELHSIADVQRELLLLAAQPPVRQSALVDLLLADGAEITTVAEAIAQFDALPQPIRIDKVDKLVERFSGLDEKQQFKFFDKNASLIEAWFARRSSKKAA